MKLNSIGYLKQGKLALKYKKNALNFTKDFFSKQHKKTNFPRIINLYITNRCNLRCPMCLNAKQRGDNFSSEFSVQTFKKILPELIKYKPFVYITGGEPLLNKELLDIIRVLEKNKVFVSITTNGVLLEKYYKEIIKSGLEFISISLDSYVAEQHDKSRGVKGTYEKVIRGIKLLVKERRKTPSNIKINTVVTKDNYKYLSKMYDFIEGLNVNEWSLEHFNFITPSVKKSIELFFKEKGIGKYADGLPIDKEYFFEKEEMRVLQEQLNKLKEKSMKYKTRLAFLQDVDDVKSFYAGKFPGRKSSCNFLFNAINIMDGDNVAFCLGYSLGNLKDNTLKELWDGKKAEDIRKLFLQNKIFPGCFRCCSLKQVYRK